MRRLTHTLERILYARPLTPVIIETTRRAWAEVKRFVEELVPPRLLKPFVRDRVFIKRLLGIIEQPLVIQQEIPMFNMIGALLPSRLVDEVASQSGVEKLYLDRLVWALPFEHPVTGVECISTWETKELLGVRVANEEGWTGKGVKVFVLDTGVRKSLNPVRHVKVRTAIPLKGGTGLDSVGHGTFCAAIIGGRRWRDPVLGVETEGMAPDAAIVSVQVLGFGVGVGMTSDIIKGIEIAILGGADIINLSLGAFVYPSLDEDPYHKAVDKAVEVGTLVVAAVGNERDILCTPGALPSVIAVGATSLRGYVSHFSSRGTYAGTVKPDVVSYGENIYAPTVGLMETTDKMFQRAGVLSGTSFAAPHVAGMLACAVQMFREHGEELNREVFEEVCRRYGHAKRIPDGYGLIRFDWFRNYLGV